MDVVSGANSIKRKDQRTLEELDKILKAAGFNTREEYIAAALQRLTPEQRAEYLNMQNSLDKTDEALQIAWNVSGGLMGISAFAGLGCQTFLSP